MLAYDRDETHFRKLQISGNNIGCTLPWLKLEDVDHPPSGSYGKVFGSWLPKNKIQNDANYCYAKHFTTVRDGMIIVI